MMTEKKPQKSTAPKQAIRKLNAQRDFPGPYWHGCPSTVRMLNAYHFIYRQYGFKFLPNAQDLVFLDWMGWTFRLEKFLKWKTANILARATGSLELVECPFDDRSDIPQLFEFYFRPDQLGFLRTDSGFHRMKLARHGCRRYASFAFSLYQSKAASLPAESWRIEKEEEACVLRLSEHKAVEGSIRTPDRTLTEDTIFDEIDRTIEEIVPYVYGTERKAAKRVPSRGACYPAISPRWMLPADGRERKGGRAVGGTLGYLNDVWVEWADWLPTDYLFGYFRGRAGRVTEVRTRFPLHLIDGARQSWEEFARSPHFRHGIPCEPVGLPEPFKVRVITKGAPEPYSLAACWQPLLWRTLKDHPTFRLIGAPVSRSDIQGLVNDQSTDKELWFLSGDYKEATDHIPSNIGNYILRRFCQRLGVPLEDTEVLVKCLTGHLFYGQIPQRSGQLMGSPISFPILCIYNAVLTRMAVELADLEGKRYQLTDIPMLVNGDDLLLVANPWVYCSWMRVVKWGGLIPSVGKTVMSRGYGTINSTLYKVTKRCLPSLKGGSPTWFWFVEHLPHVQLQLAVGSMKSGHYDRKQKRVIGKSTPLSESKQWHDFMASCRDKEKGWRFLWRANKRYLDSLSQFFPASCYCLPPMAGGLGLPLPPFSSQYWKDRRPTNCAISIAQMLLQEDSPEAVHSKRSYFAALQSFRDPDPMKNLFADMCRYRRETDCPEGFVPVSDVPDLQPPALLSYAYGNPPHPYWDGERWVEGTERQKQYLVLLRRVRAFSKTHTLWPLERILTFSQNFVWSSTTGKYV